MTFEVPGHAYGRFMGRYSDPLGARFCDWVGVQPGQLALDVGCGTGALTAPLVERLGVRSVSAIDPSPSFVAVARARFPNLDVQTGSAEQLPYADDFFDHTLAQLVVHFMRDPVAGLVEMARVTKPGGWVSTCVWDFAGERSPVSVFWQAVRDLDPASMGESMVPGARDRDLVAISDAADLAEIEQAELSVSVAHPSFEEWWEPYTYGVGPAGSYVAGLDAAQRDALRDRCRQRLPAAPFTITAVVWAARGRA